MKKITKSVESRHERFKGMRFHREDADEFIEIALSNGLVCKMSDGSHEFTSLDDVLKNRGHFVSALELNFVAKSGDYSYVRLSIDSRSTLLTAYGGDKVAICWHEIKDRISKRAPWYAKFMSPFGWAFSMLFSSYILANIALKLPDEYQKSFALEMAFLVYLFFGLGMALFSREEMGSGLVLKYALGRAADNDYHDRRAGVKKM